MRIPPFSPAFLRRAAKRVLITAAVIAVTGFLLLPTILRPVLQRKASEALHRTVSIRSIYFNPFTLVFALRGVTVGQRDSSGVMLSFDEFYVNLEAVSVIRRGLIVSSVRLVKPYVNLVRNKDLSYNFSDLLARASTKPGEKPGEKTAEEPFRFSINNIEVVNGSADLYDVPRNIRHTVRNLDLSVPFVSSLPYYLSSYVEPFFRATINGTPIALKGKTLPFNESLETSVDVNWKGVDVPHYLAYSPVPLAIRLLSGQLDVQVTLSFRQFQDRPPTVSLKGTLGLRNVRLAATGTKRFLELSSLTVTFLPSNLMEKQVHLAEVNLRAPKLYVERDRGGELVIMKALLAQLGVSKGRQEPAPAKEGPPPVIEIDAFSIHDGMVQFIDWQPVPVAAEGEEVPPKPARILIDAISLNARSLSTRRDRKGTLELALRVNRNGSVRTAGPLGLIPLDLETAVHISRIELPPFQPYVAQRAEILVKGGRFSADGTARIRAGEDGALSVAWRGSAAVSRLDLRDSRNSEDLLTWKELRFDGIDARSKPLALRIRRIALNDFLASIVVEEDGTLNLQQIVKKGPAGDEKEQREGTEGNSSDALEQTPPQPESPPDISIREVLFTRGSVSFTDRHVKPMYTASLLDIGGKVSGLSSKEDVTADVLVRASFERYAPFVLAGRINPLQKDLYIDVRADFKDMDLSTLTPYSDTYIGRAIEKGKLSFGIQYHIVQKKLEAKNDIFIDQLTLGEKVDSSKATSLPVGLAIALLKDRNGEIKLDIPVEGEIDNPEFRVWKVVLKVVVNLLVKAATSPFALLGSMMGGEDLGYVEFDYGSPGLSGENAKKLESLAKALYDRPELKLEIAGYVDPEKDSEALKAARMEGLIVAEKIKDLPRQDDQKVPPGSVQVSAAEYPVYLKKAYKSGKFSKPRNLFGFAKDLPDAEMEKLLFASIRITDDDLRQLAAERARTVQEMILKTQKVEPGRVFLVEPKALMPEQKGKLRESRVDFSLK
jgi:uncharacterized protein involved in outer membrane biogenesis